MLRTPKNSSSLTRARVRYTPAYAPYNKEILHAKRCGISSAVLLRRVIYIVTTLTKELFYGTNKLLSDIYHATMHDEDKYLVGPLHRRSQTGHSTAYTNKSYHLSGSNLTTGDLSLQLQQHLLQKFITGVQL